MRSDKKKLLKQRRIMQQKLEHLAALTEPIPPSGWIKAIRGSLGLSIRQLADLVGVGHGAINQLEKREPKKRVSLEALEKAAQAMDCKVIYAIAPINPNETLDDIIRRRATDAASNIVESVAHSMSLEAQGTSPKLVKEEVLRIATELISTNDPRIWEPRNKKAGK